MSFAETPVTDTNDSPRTTLDPNGKERDLIATQKEVAEILHRDPSLYTKCAQLIVSRDILRLEKAGMSAKELSALGFPYVKLNAVEEATIYLTDGTKRFVGEASSIPENVERCDWSPVELLGKDFAAVAKTVLDKIDRSRTGHVNKEQLAQALEDPSFEGQEAQALAALYRNFNWFQFLPTHSQQNAIDAKDLDEYQKIQAAYWKRQLVARETRASNNNEAHSEKNKGTLQAIKDFYHESIKSIEDGMGPVEKWYEDELVNRVLMTCESVHAGQMSSISRELYADKGRPTSSIVAAAITQGYIGDCYFEASLAAVAKNHPKTIFDSINDNHNGTYTVTFPGAKNEPITIKSPTQAEQGLYNHASRYGIWASVMEKAYGEYCRRHFWRRSIFNLTGGHTPAEGAAGGGYHPTIALLLGRSAKNYDLTSPMFIKEKLTDAFTHGATRAVIARPYTTFLPGSTLDKFRTVHFYTVLGFTPNAKDDSLVTVWDSVDGEQRDVTLKTFMKNFNEVWIEQ